MRLLKAGAALAALAALLASWPACARAGGRPAEASRPGPKPLVLFHQPVFEAQSESPSLDGPEAVFRAVFDALGEEAFVYTTENHYYFIIHAGGQTIWGNLRLDASDRDRGVIHLGYFAYDENGLRPLGEGSGKAFSEVDGVGVERLGPLAYAVTYRGKTVTFRLNDVGTRRPAPAHLAEDERFVGPIVDESGLSFFLLFESREKHFFYVLDEEAGVPETFFDLGEELLVGRRTGFAFYRDTKRRRKVLVGVHSSGVARNNWYDGPADQLPDNYAEETRIASYIQEAYPATRGKVDKFGGYTANEGFRVLIVPYTIYQDEAELTERLRSCAGLRAEEGRFTTCLTPHPYQ